MNADGSGQRRLTKRGALPGWSPDGRKIGFVSERDGNGEIYVVNVDGSGAAEPEEPGAGIDSWLCLGVREETVSVTAPPRPPRPSDPVDREELEALVEALFEEARQRARRRRRIYAASVALVALVVVAVSAVLQRSTQPDTASPAFAARSGLPAGATSSKLAFISHKLYDCCGRGGPFLLYVMNADGSGKRLLTPRAGGTCVVARWAEDRLQRRHPRRQGRDLRHQCRWQREAELTRTAESEIGPAWSPDGRKIAFSRGRERGEQVYVINADGSGQRRLTNLPAHNIAGLAWLPDGKITFVSSHRPNGFEIYLINADGSGQRNLTRDWGLETLSGLEPGRAEDRLREQARRQLGALRDNADGSGRRNLTRNAANDYLYDAHPWSPDGRKLVFGRDRNGDGGSDAI